MKRITRLIEVFGTCDRSTSLLAQLKETPPERLDAEVGRLLHKNGDRDVRSA
jgi:hypothetical protein